MPRNLGFWLTLDTGGEVTLGESSSLKEIFTLIWGTPTILVIQAHQEDMLEAIIRSCDKFLMSVSGFALHES